MRDSAIRFANRQHIVGGESFKKRTWDKAAVVLILSWRSVVETMSSSYGLRPLCGFTRGSLDPNDATLARRSLDCTVTGM
jgi:hypothetical protein